MPHLQRTLTFRAPSLGLHDITAPVARWVEGSEIRIGLLTLFIRHTSASLTIQENADPDVVRDLEDFFSRLAPENPSLYRHRTEGPDDMPAHIRSALTDTTLTIPVSDARMMLGTWQAIYLWEHRSNPTERQVVLHLAGELHQEENSD